MLAADCLRAPDPYGTISEYEQVLCAALLHDIGKFYQRANESMKRHEEYSVAFVEHYHDALPNSALLATLVKHHHEGQYAKYPPKDLLDERERMLAYLISRADNYSSSERPEAEKTKGYQTRAALDSLFCQVKIGNPGETVYQDRLTSSGSRYTYQLGRLLTSEMTPEQQAAEFSHSLEDFQTHESRFRAEFEACFPHPYVGMCDTLLHLIRKYLWCVPSDTTKELRDISLADHLQTTCALAACIYQYQEEQGWDEKSVKNDTLLKFSLVSGDISGIQQYLYSIAHTGHGGVAKRLRGRSFKISLLTEACALRILHDLNLPLACRIMSAGGRFYLLIPHTSHAQSMLVETKRLINQWLLDQYHGELAITVVASDLPTSALQQGQFDVVLQAINRTLDTEKRRKFSEALEKGPLLFDVSYQGNRNCPVCERLPATGSPADPHPCRDCEKDALLGSALTNNEWLAIGTGKAVGDAIDLFGDWHATLLPHRPDQRNLISYNLNSNELLPGMPSGFLPKAGYVPRWETEEECASYLLTCEKDSRDPTLSDEDVGVTKVKSFRALAYSRCTGVKRLAILRADVDHLGLIFSMGLHGKGSLSRLSSLSFLLQAFFCVEMPRMIVSNFRNTYIAYAGGDDLMLIGPWEETIELSERIAKAFARFTADNPAFTISAGIGVFNHRAPIALTSRQTGDLLESAKDAGRNRLALFDAVLEWPHYAQMRRLAHLLSDERVSKAFLYRLLGYARQAVSYYQQHDARGLLFRPHLAYDLGRNYTDADGKPKLELDLYEYLRGLIAGGEDALARWHMLSAPITWAALATRERRNEP
jgi:CRISPR-associated protein Csm1